MNFTALICNESLGCKVSFDINQWTRHQFFEALFIGFEIHSTMHINAQVGPDIVYCIYFIMLNNAFNNNLNPSRNTHYNSDVPIFCGKNDFFELCFPVAFHRNAFTWLVMSLKPKRNLCSVDAT